MCDNIVALGQATADGSVIFGKNSDREPNEPHYVVIIPRAVHARSKVTHCTYIDIPQVEETYAVLLCRPSWLWGAEMGANEHGLVIGNTAVFTRESYDTRPGLIGMDFLRLALERTTNALSALELITTFLEQYGQSGNNGFSHELYYHNSFLIADPREAWVLETVGRQWVAKQVEDIGGTSNTLTIETEWDLASDDLITYAQARGWSKNRADFNFKESYGGAGFYASYLYTVFGSGDERYQRLTGLLEQQQGQITEEVIMSALRDHGPKADENYSPARGRLQNPPVCTPGPDRYASVKPPARWFRIWPLTPRLIGSLPRPRRVRPSSSRFGLMLDCLIWARCPRVITTTPPSGGATKRCIGGCYAIMPPGWRCTALSETRWKPDFWPEPGKSEPNRRPNEPPSRRNVLRRQTRPQSAGPSRCVPHHLNRSYPAVTCGSGKKRLKSVVTISVFARTIRRVLVVDDNSLILALFQAFLEGRGLSLTIHQHYATSCL